MAITTYAELQSAVSNWLDRTDLSDRAPEFIALAEAAMKRDVRHYSMEAREALTIDGRYEDLPSDWVETIRVEISKSSGITRIDLASRDEMLQMRTNTTQAAAPCYYAHVAGQLEFYPTPDQAYTGEIVYYQAIPSLSDAATSNWLLVAAPDAYLYGALMQSAPFLVEDERLITWNQLYQTAIASLNADSRQATHSGSGLRMRMRK